jgi:hypothetical protein
VLRRISVIRYLGYYESTLVMFCIEEVSAWWLIAVNRFGNVLRDFMLALFSALCLVGRAQKTIDTGAQGVRTCPHVCKTH